MTFKTIADLLGPGLSRVQQEKALNDWCHQLASLDPSLLNERVNSKDQYGLTALHYASAFGQVESVRTLLDLGASIDLLDAAKRTPLFSCLMIPVFYDQEFIHNKLFIATMLIDRMTPKALEQRDESGNTVLHEVVLSDLSEILSKLIQKNKHLLFIANNSQRYPIHLAILNSKPKNVDIMLQVEGIEALSDGKGRNALHYSAFYGGKEMLELCCTRCKDLNFRDEDRKTPLMQAAFTGHLALVKILVLAGADCSLQSLSGKNAIDYAKEENHHAVVDYLKGFQ